MTGLNSAPSLDDLVMEMSRLRAELNALKSKANHHTQTEQPMSQPEIKNQPETTVTTTRRKTLKRLGLALLGGAVAATAMTAAPEAQAKVSAHPQGNGMTDKVGMLVLPPGAMNVTGTAPNVRVGLIASGVTFPEQSLDLTDLDLNSSTGLVGVGSWDATKGIGVYAKGGYGVQAEGSSNGVYATSSATSGIAVYGSATGVESQGVSGFSDKGVGVHAASGTGTPLRITAGASPASGVRQLGDIYVNSTDGFMYMYSGGGWKKIAFA